MEAEFVIRYQIAKPEVQQLHKEMLCDGEILFEEDVAASLQQRFQALEDLTPPEEMELQASGAFVGRWMAGSDFDDQLQEVVLGLQGAGATKIVVYYWADEEEGFYTCNADGLRLLENWEAWAKSKGIDLDEDDDAWIDSCLAHLQHDY